MRASPAPYFVYDNWFEFPAEFAAEHFKLRFRQAGHILGSSYVEIENVNTHYRVVFSGDLGCKNTPLLPDPTPLERADFLLLESTYGDKNHESRADRSQRLKAVVERCVENKGVILIPAFSIGRTQELLYELEDIIHQARELEAETGVADPVWHKMAVILDSPLAAQFTKQYRAMKNLWDEEAHQRLDEDRHPLNFDRLLTVDEHSEHERIVNFLQRSGDPCIVIAASGMCTGGRIEATEEPVKRIRLIHGEADARLALAAKIRERYGLDVT